MGIADLLDAGVMGLRRPALGVALMLACAMGCATQGRNDGPGRPTVRSLWEQAPHLRIARPTTRLDEVVRFYRDAVGLEVLGQFTGHAGFDGVMLGRRDLGWHLEFTREQGAPAPPTASDDQLLVLYVPDVNAWNAALRRMSEHGCTPLPSHNPYWDVRGKTFQDPDGFRVVFQRAEWSP